MPHAASRCPLASRIVRALAALGVALALLPGAALAQLTVDRSIIEFAPDARIQDIEVANTGDYRLYLDLSVAEILEPETEEPVRRPFDDPRTAPVLVTPKQVLLPPGERKRVRIVMREADAERERVFRLLVKPYVGKVDVAREGPEDKASAVKVLVAYDLLLLSRPARPAPRLEVTRTEDSIEFRNEGNTNILLRKVRQCDVLRQDCTDLSTNRLYAGETWKVALPVRGSADDPPRGRVQRGRAGQRARGVLTRRAQPAASGVPAEPPDTVRHATGRSGIRIGSPSGGSGTSNSHTGAPSRRTVKVAPGGSSAWNTPLESISTGPRSVSKVASTTARPRSSVRAAISSTSRRARTSMRCTEPGKRVNSQLRSPMPLDSTPRGTSRTR